VPHNPTQCYDRASTSMKELLTKTFWQGVKKTYDDALQGPTPEEKQIPQETKPTPDSPQPHSPPQE
jgi:hypothetical protein